MMKRGIKSNIDYHKIADAIDFYQDLGYSYIEVPWIVSRESHDITGKGYSDFSSFLGTHVASAEQSFLELITNNELDPGRYLACSPCFRDDDTSQLYNKWFMKVELINYLGKIKSETPDLVKSMIRQAYCFFERYLDITVEKTDIGLDIVSDCGVELGSYGFRTHNDFSWVYGTGVAEPRLSHCLDKIPKGYHDNNIPRGKFGTSSKIYEEIQEFKDAEKDENPIMSLLELSDLVGALEGYLETEFKGKITLDHLIKMNTKTRRAFENGIR